MGTTAEGLADVACQGADVGAFGTHHADGDIGELICVIGRVRRSEEIFIPHPRARDCHLACEDRMAFTSQTTLHQLYLVNHQHFGFQLHLFLLAGEVIGALAIDLHGRVGGRHLLDAPEEVLQGRFHLLAGDVLRGIVGIDGMFQVEAGSGSAQT